MDIIKGYKTVLFNVVMTVGTLIAVWTGIDTSTQVDQANEGIEYLLTGITTLWMVGNAWLRTLTDSPIFKSR